MKKNKWIPAVIILTVILITAFIQGFCSRKMPVDQIYTISHEKNGNSIVSWYQNNRITIANVDPKGKITKSVTMPQSEKDVIYQIQAAQASDDGRIYVLRNALNEYTGELMKEDLLVYDFNQLLPGKVVVDVRNLQSPEAEKSMQENWHYGWMNISGDVISVIGTNSTETMAARRVFEFGALSDRSVNIKSERYYPLAEKEGVYQAVGNGTDIAYISKSGKVFHAAENKVEEIYPARVVDVLMYPLYITFAESGYVYMQDGESGDILKLNIQDGTESLVKKGTEGFAGRIKPVDIAMMSMQSVEDFTSVVKDTDGKYLLCSMNDGVWSETGVISLSVGQLAINIVRYALTGILISAVLVLLIFGIYRGITRGKTILSKLLLAALPLMILTMSVFGMVVYHYYEGSVTESYEKQVLDEGNMMTALFGQESFDALQYPYDYVSDDYRYLQEQMQNRDLYARVVYFEDGVLYTGVDQQNPCFYPVSINVNTTLENLYLRAARSGMAQSATVNDHMGERIISITPVGGTAGRSVYLYETGVYTAKVDAYQQIYIRNFLWICAAFLIVLAVLLTALYMRILLPLSEIRQGMELFADGNRDIRIEPETQDELAGISRVFNKMADDIDLQILNLKNLSDIYYKFMPMSIIRMLKQDNLGNLMPGSCMKGTYTVLSIQLKSSVSSDNLQEKAREMNRFFNLINDQAVKQGAMPIVDNSNLSGILLICPNGVGSAIQTALTILANVDVHNAQVMEQNGNPLQMSVVLHKTEVSVVICGDEKQYIPATVIPDMDKILTGKERFLELDTRLFITAEAIREIKDPGEYGLRYVGKLGVESWDNGFYECYDDRDAEKIHMIRISDSNFRKAVKLFEEGYLYEAKNLFAMVLQDNPDDQIAKYYIFRCG